MRLSECFLFSFLSSTTFVAAWDGYSYQERDLYVRNPYPDAYAESEASYPDHYVPPRTPRGGCRGQERNIDARNAYPSAHADSEVPYSKFRVHQRDLYIRDAYPSSFVDAEIPYSDRSLLSRTPKAHPEPTELVAPQLEKGMSSPIDSADKTKIANSINLPLKKPTPTCGWIECSNHCWCDATGKVQCYSMRIDAGYSVPANAFTISCRRDCKCPS